MQLFAYSWQDVSVLLGMEPRKAQRLAREGKFDPRDLESLARFWASADAVRGRGLDGEP